MAIFHRVQAVLTAAHSVHCAALACSCPRCYITASGHAQGSHKSSFNMMTHMHKGQAQRVCKRVNKCIWTRSMRGHSLRYGPQYWLYMRVTPSQLLACYPMAQDTDIALLGSPKQVWKLRLTFPRLSIGGITAARQLMKCNLASNTTRTWQQQCIKTNRETYTCNCYKAPARSKHVPQSIPQQ
jgi:hypothetical protein